MPKRKIVAHSLRDEAEWVVWNFSKNIYSIFIPIFCRFCCCDISSSEKGRMKLALLLLGFVANFLGTFSTSIFCLPEKPLWNFIRCLMLRGDRISLLVLPVDFSHFSRPPPPPSVFRCYLICSLWNFIRKFSFNSVNVVSSRCIISTDKRTSECEWKWICFKINLMHVPWNSCSLLVSVSGLLFESMLCSVWTWWDLTTHFLPFCTSLPTPPHNSSQCTEMFIINVQYQHRNTRKIKLCK